MKFDCVVIGGGPAGLTAAIYLGRFRRDVLVVDAGHSRALSIPTSHNYPGFADGIAGADLLRVLREQAVQYGAQLRTGLVAELASNGDAFTMDIDGETVTAPRVLLATGLQDHAPDMPGLQRAVAETAVRYCPVCDAYEATDLAIAVHGAVKDAEAKALFMRTYSRNVTLVPDHDGIDAGARTRLAEAGIAIAPSAASDIRPEDGGIGVELRNGERLTFDVLYPVLGCEVYSGLATALGARSTEVGCVVVDDKQQTTVPGLYAAGDVVSDLHQLSVGAGHAAIAATAIHRSLPSNFR